MTDPGEREKLAALDDRLKALKQTQEPAPKNEEHYSQAQHAWRMVVELVAGLGIGFGIGYGLDVLFGTLPWFLVTFTLLGFVAGVRVMIRTAQELQETAQHEQGASGADGDG